MKNLEDRGPLFLWETLATKTNVYKTRGMDDEILGFMATDRHNLAIKRNT